MSLLDIIYENLSLKNLTIKRIANFLNQIYIHFYSTSIKFIKR